MAVKVERTIANNIGMIQHQLKSRLNQAETARDGKTRETFPSGNLDKVVPLGAFPC